MSNRNLIKFALLTVPFLPGLACATDSQASIATPGTIETPEQIEQRVRAAVKNDFLSYDAHPNDPEIAKKAIFSVRQCALRG